MRRLANCIGVDDAPFARAHRGDVDLVGTVWADRRLDGVVRGRVRRDGVNATDAVIRMVTGSRFDGHVRLVMLQGIAFAGFNVVDLDRLHEELGRAVLVVARDRPDLEAIERALRTRVPGGARKWNLIDRAGPMERSGRVWIQRRGITPAQAREVLARTTIHGHLPEPIRVAHLLASALARGESRGGA